MLTAHPAAPAHPELSRLLAAAAAPARPDELAGLSTAVAAFEEAGRDTSVSVPPVTRRSLLVRPVAAKIAAGVAVVLFGGVALAAETGNLPGGTQQRAHELFSPLGVPSPHASASPAATRPPAVETTPSRAPSPDNNGRTLDPTSPAVLGLCRAWQALQNNPNDKPMTAEAFRDLAGAAGGEQRVSAFCGPLLADDSGRTARPPGAATDSGGVKPTPSRPGGTGPAKLTPSRRKEG